MKSSLICFLVAVGLIGSLTAAQVVEAKSYSSSSSSSSSSSNKSSPPSPSSSGRLNSITNPGGKQITTVNSNSSAISNPVKASYTPKSVVTTSKPSDSTIVDKKHIAPNPDNKPTEIRYITRYGSDNRSYSVPLVIPIGMPYNTSLIGDSYFPITARRTTVYNNGDSKAEDIASGIVVGASFLVGIIVIGCVVIVVIRSFRSY